MFSPVSPTSFIRFVCKVYPQLFPLRNRSGRLLTTFLSTDTAFSPLLTKMTSAYDYPAARRDENVKETHFGVEVFDPYRWLEDPDSEETRAFVEAQNKITMPYLHDCPNRQKLHEKLIQLWDYPKYSCPYRHGTRYFYYMNTGLQNQSVMYVQESLDGESRVFLDPNMLSSDGTVSISRTSFSEDENIMAYSLSKSGSDWVTIHFRDVKTGKDYPDILEHVKFTSVSWTHDNLGVFYSRYPSTDEKCDGSETTCNKNNKLYYHRLNTPQSEDILCVEFPEEPNFVIDAEVSDCGQYLLLMPRKLIKDNLLFYCDLKRLPGGKIESKLPLTQIVHQLEADYIYVTNDGPEFIFRTNKDAPNYRLIKIDLRKPEPENWETLLPQHDIDVLDWVCPSANDKLVVCYIHDVKNVLSVHKLSTGELIRNLPLPLGTITGFSGRRKYEEVFYQFTSYLSPGIIYRCDLTEDPPQEPTIFREIVLPGFDSSEYEQNQVFYPSKDGTSIPMFIVHKKGLKLDGRNPCLLYGYGGFNLSLQPAFSLSRILWMRHFGGVVAIANLRGGGEFGERWHNAGRLLNKQNVFDDFQSAGEYLIAQNYTCKDKLSIQGGSNGGFLVAACLNQRPDLFKAGLIQVGVLDLLRFHKFTIGAMWISDYGSPDEEKHFKNLLKLSPLHNIPHLETEYPATLLTTADHDDRVVPLHSLKFIAELQNVYKNNPNQKNPLLIRVDTKAGHGGGKPTSKTIEENTDLYCFLMKNLGIQYID